MLQEFAASHLGQGSQKAVANPLFMGMTPAQYVLAALEKVRPAEMEQALLLLPFNYALNLLEYLCYWLEKGLKVRLHLQLVYVHMDIFGIAWADPYSLLHVMVTHSCIGIGMLSLLR